MERAAISRQLGHINVLDEGVKNDGTGDQTAALNAAFIKASAALKTLYFPAGAYRILSTVNVKAPIQGAIAKASDQFQTVRINNGDGGVANGIQDGSPMFLLDSTASPEVARNFSMFGILFYGQFKNCIGFEGRGTLTAGVHAVTDYRIQDCIAIICDIGFKMFGWIGVLNQCSSWGCNTTGLRLIQANAGAVVGGTYDPAESDAGIHGVNHFGNTTWAKGGWGIQIFSTQVAQGSDILHAEGTNGVTLSYVTTESNGQCNGIQIAEGVAGVTLQGIYTEGFEGRSDDISYQTWALQVGKVRGDGSARTTAVTSSNAVSNLTIIGGQWGMGSSTLNPNSIVQLEFDNVFGLHLIGSPNSGGGSIRYTNNCKNVSGSWGSYWAQGYVGVNATTAGTHPDAGGAPWDYKYGRDQSIVDESGQIGLPAWNYWPQVHGTSGTRGMRTVVKTGDTSTAAGFGPSGWKGFRVVAATATTDTALVRFYPWGMPDSTANLTMVGRLIVASGWCYPTGSQYSSKAQWPAIGIGYENSTDGATWNYQEGMWRGGWNNGSIDVAFMRPDKWNQFHVWLEVPNLTYGIKNVCLSVRPTSNGANTTSGGHSLYLSRLFFGTASCVDDAPAGRWTEAPDGAKMLPGGGIMIYATAPPTDSSVVFSVGDRVIHSAPNLSGGTNPGIDSWTCTTGGFGGTAVWQANAFSIAGSGISLGSNQLVMGTAAPTTGAWIRGDKVQSSVVTAGGNEGWVCISSGTPGTWVPYGYVGSG